ncbi:protein translocase subunit SecF [Pelagibaculum spongiae]|uniref:Protein-export membrane protein SecF n=1 Tax=Pelagibaculum spongiae TaxID=2080658 RepID=A0A2V1GZ65_9GAMM|nr:protein translocase subunit SecF [Pelagibaculum spongiae]PVZ72361.1 protein translocase subunit SecF [Pelagibaculum spongiae]
MQIFNKESSFRFMAQRKLAAIFSIVLIVISIGSLAINQLNFGLDFTGGTVAEVGYQQSADLEPIREQLVEAGFNSPVVTHFGSDTVVLIRLGVQRDESGKVLSGEAIRPILEKAVAIDGEAEFKRMDVVGPQIGEELSEQGGMAVLVALLGILLYVGFRFEYRFAFGAIAALVHDVVITLGFFSITGIEFDLAVMAAVLAVIGYSLNDTIVVADRIRENFRKMRKGDTVEVIDASLNQTLSRTIITSLTTMLVLVALKLFGGEAISGFSIALIVGVVIGTYSSIYVASSTLVALGISRQDLMPKQRDEAEKDDIEEFLRRDRSKGNVDTD